MTRILPLLASCIILMITAWVAADNGHATAAAVYGGIAIMLVAVEGAVVRVIRALEAKA